MVTNNDIHEIFNTVYNLDFESDVASHRRLMHNAIYLLQCMNVGKLPYKFTWTKYGPYSAQLYFDMFNKPVTGESVKSYDLSMDTKNGLRLAITGYIGVYDMVGWSNCLTYVCWNYRYKSVSSNSITFPKQYNNDVDNRSAVNALKILGLLKI